MSWEADGIQLELVANCIKLGSNNLAVRATGNVLSLFILLMVDALEWAKMSFFEEVGYLFTTGNRMDLICPENLQLNLEQLQR